MQRYFSTDGYAVPMLSAPDCPVEEVSRFITRSGDTVIEYCGHDGRAYCAFKNEDGIQWLMISAAAELTAGASR
jgi:hypothetical protein